MKARSWDEENRGKVINMLEMGASASKIAAQFDLSRNAVIGRISRDPELHGHVHRQPGIQRIPKSRKKKPLPQFDRCGEDFRHNLPAGEPPKPAAPRRPRMRLLPLKDLRPNQCRWPVEERDDVVGRHLFCGADTEAFQVYCPWHTKMAKPGGH